MKAPLNLIARALLLAAVSVLLLGASGCATTEPGNASSRPWNSPKSWETGLPGGLFDRR